jgi:bifunctional DNA-binding transcriptional regulator/antitoxin component of YhaV-PrlF toxin-antitoxin module
MPGLPILVPPDATRGAGIRCVVTPVDRDGRLADRSVLTFMGWSAGQAVELAIEPGPIVVARTGRTVRINPRGHLRLPLTVRRRCRIAAGDRVLAAANRRRVELLVIPMATVDDMVVLYRHADDSGAGL